MLADKVSRGGGPKWWVGRDQYGNRAASPAAYRAVLRAVHMLARRGLVESGRRRLWRDRRPRLPVWLPGRGR